MGGHTLLRLHCGESEHLGGALRLVQRPRHPQPPTRPPHSPPFVPGPNSVRVPVLEIIGDRVGQSWGPGEMCVDMGVGGVLRLWVRSAFTLPKRGDALR